MRFISKKRLFLVLFTCISSLLFSADLRKDVNLGYPSIINFSEGIADYYEKTGYGYEYMQKISNYTGWNYSYTYGTWNDLFNKLINSEIDVLFKVPKTEENQKLMYFSSEPMGTESYFLFIKSEKPNGISLNDKSSVDGKKIGVQKSSEQLKLLQNWLSLNQLNCEIIEYYSETFLDLALKENEVDAVILPDTTSNPFLIPYWSVGSYDYYCAIAKKRPDLVDSISYAQIKIKQDNHVYNELLKQKYYNTRTQQIQLDASELRYINSHKKLNVGYINDYIPYCYNYKGQMQGVFREVLEVLSQNFDIEFTYIPYNSTEELLHALHLHNIDIMLPTISDLWNAEQNLISITNPITTAQVTIVYKNDFDFETTNTIAITDKLPLQKPIAQGNYKTSTINNYKDINACFNAIKKGEAGCTIINNFVVDNYRNRYASMISLKTAETPISVDMAMGVNKSQVALLSFLNKGIKFTTATQINESLIKNTHNAKDFSFLLFIRRHLFLSIIVILVLYYMLYTATKHLSRILKENKNSRIDTLTGLLNRKTMNTHFVNAMKNAIDKDQPFSFIMFDIDNFKKVNDTYGHECGDIILKMVANTLKGSIRDHDFAFRWGGEELLILLIAEGNIAEKVANRIRMKIEKQTVYYNSVGINVTVTGGVSTYKSGRSIQDMLTEADENLYKGKHNGKNQVIFEP